MADGLLQTGMVGLCWVVEDQSRAALIAHAVSKKQAAIYGDMLTVETGHFDYWSELARLGAHALSTRGIPTAPGWSEYDEWPRGRVLYDCLVQRFVIRADRQLHRPMFVRLIANHFRIAVESTAILSDDHYRSFRHVPPPNGDDVRTTET